MEKLRGLAADPAWRRSSPVIHNLDWQLRMLPPQSPEQTFRAHADACASAARILRRARMSEPVKGESIDLGEHGGALIQQSLS
jgi:hypothetical protein